MKKRKVLLYDMSILPDGMTIDDVIRIMNEEMIVYYDSKDSEFKPNIEELDLKDNGNHRDLDNIKLIDLRPDINKMKSKNMLEKGTKLYKEKYGDGYHYIYQHKNSQCPISVVESKDGSSIAGPYYNPFNIHDPEARAKEDEILNKWRKEHPENFNR